MPSVLPSSFSRSLLSDNTERRFGFRRPSFSSSRPMGPAEGDAFYELDTDKFYLWNGSAWVQQVASGSWDTWTPTVSGVTNTNRLGRWTRMGRTIIASFHVSGTVSTVSSGRIGVTMPVAPQTNRLMWGGAYMLDAGVYEYTITIRPGDGGGAQIMFLYGDIGSPGNGVVGDGGVFPFAFLNGDVIAGTCIYEAAASV